jgi:hypothetical protein
MVMAAATSSPAQTPGRIGSEYIPIDAAATVVLSVADTMASPAVQFYPVEVAEAWCEQNIGFPASRIDRIKVVVGVPGPSGPTVAVIAMLKADLDVQSLNREQVQIDQPIDVDGHACYPISAAPELVVHLKDPRTLMLATPAYLDPVLRAADSSSPAGALAKMAAGVPHSGNLTALVAIEPVRPMLQGLMQMQAEQIPPPLAELTRAPELLDAVLWRVNLADSKEGLQLTMLGRDEASAEQLLEVIKRALDFGRQIGMAQAMNGVQGDDAVAQASRQYVQRVADMLVTAFTPVRDGRRLTISGSPSQGLATQGVLVGLLLPAVQASREAARRMASSNNLKMIGLAMHNYHDTYRHFPGDIQSADGTPLLSWRVAILPFIEQQELYNQFHLDEPYDSPHNIQLLEQMPAIYAHAGRPTPPGSTIYQRPVDEGFLMDPGKEIRMADITDGTSNTIMACEAAPDKAVPWSKPDDLTIDPANPLSGLVFGPGFQVLLADGSVRFLTANIDPQMFAALLTRGGGEPVNP